MRCEVYRLQQAGDNVPIVDTYSRKIYITPSEDVKVNQNYGQRQRGRYRASVERPQTLGQGNIINNQLDAIITVY